MGAGRGPGPRVGQEGKGLRWAWRKGPRPSLPTGAAVCPLPTARRVAGAGSRGLAQQWQSAVLQTPWLQGPEPREGRGTAGEGEERRPCTPCQRTHSLRKSHQQIKRQEVPGMEAPLPLPLPLSLCFSLPLSHLYLCAEHFSPSHQLPAQVEEEEEGAGAWGVALRPDPGHFPFLLHFCKQ